MGSIFNPNVLKLPTFDGNPEDYRSWKCRINRFCWLEEYSDEDSYHIAVRRLREPALGWWRDLQYRRNSAGRPFYESWKKLKNFMEEKLTDDLELPIQCPTKKESYSKNVPATTAMKVEVKEVSMNELQHKTKQTIVDKAMEEIVQEKPIEGEQEEPQEVILCYPESWPEYEIEDVMISTAVENENDEVLVCSSEVKFPFSIIKGTVQEEVNSSNDYVKERQDETFTQLEEGEQQKIEEHRDFILNVPLVDFVFADSPTTMSWWDFFAKVIPLFDVVLVRILILQHYKIRGRIFCQGGGNDMNMLNVKAILVLTGVKPPLTGVKGKRAQGRWTRVHGH